MRQRDELWKALTDASDAVDAAFDAYKNAETPANRFKAQKAGREYANCLAPVIGNDSAFRYEAALQNHTDAVDRHTRFMATLAGRPGTIDESEATMLRLLQEESDAAGRVLDEVITAIQRELVEAAERDEQR
jgi:DNA-binding GntR family transcriptional regulator